MMRGTMSAALLLVLFGATPAFAGEQQGRVTGIWLHADSSQADILVSGRATNKPACATEVFWKLDTASREGEKLLAALLTSMSGGTPVIIYGTGNCALYPTRETIAYVRFSPNGAM
jgi:hypothetical protein